MADPLSVLGAATGVISLIMQVTDQCIKCFKYYSEATNMPETCRFLHLRLQLEQQRFLNFGLEAGILYTDGKLCRTLHIKCDVLLAILAEIRFLLEEYASSNGEYEKYMTRKPVDWGDDKEPVENIMHLLCLPNEDEIIPQEEYTTVRPNQYMKRLHNFGKSFTQTGRKLRTIVLEPKRLVWVAQDKSSFEKLISKLGDLNSFLMALLSDSQLRRIQDSMDTAYLEILQIRNDVQSLSVLVKALTSTEMDGESRIRKSKLEENLLSHAVAEETAAEKRKRQHLRQLADIKIQLARIDRSGSDDSITSHISNKFISNPLQLNQFQFRFAEEVHESEELPQRMDATYQGNSVWIEWKSLPALNSMHQNVGDVETRINLLTDLLCNVKPIGFRAPRCLGYLKRQDSDDVTRFGIVFDKTSRDYAQAQLTSLHGLLRRSPKPSLSARVSLCAVLARCVHTFHSVNWLHKGLRSDNVVFLASSSSDVDIGSPYVSGYELSRPSIVDAMTEKPRFDPSEDIYRHPRAQSGQIHDSYRKSYDWYSLGIILIEVALWKRIEEVVALKSLTKVRPFSLQKMKGWLLGLSPIPNSPTREPVVQQLDSACGSAFRKIVEWCLTADEIEKGRYADEPSEAVAPRLQRAAEQDVVKELGIIAGALQGNI